MEFRFNQYSYIFTQIFRFYNSCINIIFLNERMYSAFCLLNIEKADK